jgi:site-specific DNA recombinase
MRVAAYVRVSTTRQVQQQTIEQQVSRLSAYAHEQGWVLAEEDIFRDDGYSGTSLARPGLDRLRDQVHYRAFDRVLVTAPDRLARNYVQQMVLLDEFARHSCSVDFLERPMSADPHDQLLLQIRSAVAEYERTLIAERMRRGRLSKLQAGLMLPWTRPPYGYRLDPEHPRDPSGVRIEPAEAAVVAELFAVYLQPRMTLAQLAKLLQQRGVLTPSGQRRWSCPTIRGILRNPTYTGQVYAQRTRYRAPQIRRSATHALGRPHGTATPQPAETWITVGTVPAIVSQEQFDQVQAKLAQNQSFARRHNTRHQYLLRALVSCGRCHLACTARTVHGQQHYYLCNGKSQAVHAHRDTPCPARYIPAEHLDEVVWQDLCDLLTRPEHLAQALARAQGGAWLPQELQARRENLRAGRTSLRQQRDRLTDAYLHGVIPLAEYERRRQALDQQDEGLAHHEEQLEGEAERCRDLAGVASGLEAFRQRVCQGLADATFDQRRELLVLLVDRVVVTDGDLEMRYVLPTSPQSEHVRFCHLRKDYFDDAGQVLGVRGHIPQAFEEGGQLGQALGGVRHTERGDPLARIVNDHRVMVLISPIDPGIPHTGACLSSETILGGRGLIQGARGAACYDRLIPGVVLSKGNLSEAVEPRGGSILSSLPSFRRVYRPPGPSVEGGRSEFNV